MSTFEPVPEYARRLDAEDPLASFREAFVLEDPDEIYLLGNSLGRVPKATIERMKTVVEEEWGHDLIGGWSPGWYEAPARIGEKIATMVGAAGGQVLVSDSTTINLFKLAMAALALRSGRRRIVTDDLNFPSDVYALESCARLMGPDYSVHRVRASDGITLDPESLLDAVDGETALVSLSHVVFKSAFLHDAEEITRRAQEKGALVLWDLSHSVGAVPIELDRWNVDLAVGCTYKYLNGGPASPAFLYVRSDLQTQTQSPIWGWFGQHSPFAFDLDYRPADGIRRFLVSSPPVLSLVAMEPGLDLILEAGMDNIRKKSEQLTSYVIDLVDALLVPMGFTLGTPRESRRRGSHVTIRHADAYRINRALIEEMKVLPDFREPDNIRLGLAPLYVSFGDVWEAVDRIRRVVVEERYRKYSNDRSAIT
jgi:kynureninase